MSGKYVKAVKVLIGIPLAFSLAYAIFLSLFEMVDNQGLRFLGLSFNPKSGADSIIYLALLFLVAFVIIPAILNWIHEGLAGWVGFVIFIVIMVVGWGAFCIGLWPTATIFVAMWIVAGIIVLVLVLVIGPKLQKWEDEELLREARK